MYNRQDFIGRTLRSCLAQEFRDFEVVVVDDASTDGSVDVVRQFDDGRIRLLRHERNLGRCPSRNTGMAAARGDWFVFLDSDDELLPGALTAIHRRASAAAAQVGALRLMCVDQRGTSPVPPHADEVLDYEGFIRSLDPMIHSGRQEALPCARAQTFPAVRFPHDHSQEGLYHLAMARHYLIETCHEVVRRYHHDAPNQITAPDRGRALLYAADYADDAAHVLADHGDALRRWAPASYRLTLNAGALGSFLAGRRGQGIRYSFEGLALRPFSIGGWVRLVAGLLGARTLATLQCTRASALRKLRA
jgi:glycosyltransferase involved in cell wall biosynthesis